MLKTLALKTMLDRYETNEFEYRGQRRRVFTRGNGPGIIVMSEVPGIYKAVIEFADSLVTAGYRVYMPDLFGKAGKPFSTGYALKSILGACISREFKLLASRSSSPITVWLRALARKAHADCGGLGVGCIGMCLTGNFALAMMVDEAVAAPVLSQPSLPFPVTRSRRAALHLSDDDLATVKQRVEAGCKVLGLRFTKDLASPPERFETLRRELGDGFEGIEIDSSPGNPHGIRIGAHSVVTRDLVDKEGHPTREALERLLRFFEESLRTSGATS